MWHQSALAGFAVSGVMAQLDDAGFGVTASVSDVYRQGFNLFTSEAIFNFLLNLLGQLGLPYFSPFSQVSLL